MLSAALAGGPVYTVVDLGTLGGSSAVAFKINDSGAVVGWATTPFNDQRAFLASGSGAMQDLYPSASGASAQGINSSGTIVGISYEGGAAHGEIWSAAGNVDLGAGVFAMGINDPGVVIGGNGHAFALVNGAYIDLGVLPGGSWSAAYGINNSGTIVGYGDTASGALRGFVSTSSGMAELGTLGGASSYAMAVNGGGEVAGHSTTAAGYDHAFMAIGAFLYDLGTLGGSNSYAYGINDSGQVVGYSYLANGAEHAFVYTPGGMTDLNSLIGAGSGWQLLEAYGINNSGQIVGEGIYYGQVHAFRLDPVATATSAPEPSTMILLALGLVILLPRIAANQRSSGST